MIRPVRSADFQELLAIEGQAFPKSQYDLGEFWSLYQLYSTTFLVAESDQVDGYIVFTPEGHVLSMAVAVERRRRGIGTRLVQEAIARCGGGSLRLEVRVSNVGAQSFYRTLGFRSRGRVLRYYRDGEDAIVMERQ